MMSRFLRQSGASRSENLGSRNGHTQQPRPSVDDGVAVKALHAVRTGLRERAWYGRRILHGSLEHRADELLGLEIARHHAAVSIDQRDRRAWRQCETREESSEARKVEAETENTVDHAGCRANRKRKKDRLTPGNRTDHQLAHGRTALSDDLKNERRRRRLRHPRLDARGHETTVGRAQQHVVQQRLIVQDANEHRFADVAVERAHGRMELQHRRTRVQAREVLVEHGGGGGRNRTGFVADLAGALGARQDGGPG